MEYEIVDLKPTNEQTNWLKSGGQTLISPSQWIWKMTLTITYLVFVEAIYKKNHMPNSQLQSSSIMHSMALASYLPM